MQFVMAGRVFSLNELDPATDKAFLDLYVAFFGSRPYNLAEFERAAVEFFTRTSTDASAHNDFFNNFTIIWRPLLDNRRFDEAESLWEIALRPALAWEMQQQGGFIHKGTPYYFWGMSAILKGDLDKGYALRRYRKTHIYVNLTTE